MTIPIIQVTKHELAKQQILSLTIHLNKHNLEG